MGEYVQAFLLGNGAILSNVCMLPLYPGLIAFLAGTGGGGGRRGGGLLGVVVLAGVLSAMLGIGLVLFQLQRSVSAILPWLLPLVYGIVVALGVAMLLGRNPFARLATAQAPVLRNPFGTAYLYGLLLGPMTLPCTGPVVIGAFVLGVGNVASLVDGLLYFLAFGVGFGWPLALLPLIAVPAQRRITGWLGRHHALVARVAGVALVAVGLFGVWVDVLPNLDR